MKIIDIDIEQKINLEEVKRLNLCLGFFDGVHLGHQDLINKALAKGVTGVMTFDVPPNFALGINITNCCLTSIFDKANILEKMGVKYFYILRMSKNLLNMSKDEFIEKILKPINPEEIFVGDDYRFGFEAKGTPNYLSNFSQAPGIDRIVNLLRGTPVVVYVSNHFLQKPRNGRLFLPDLLILTQLSQIPLSAH